MKITLKSIAKVVSRNQEISAALVDAAVPLLLFLFTWKNVINNDEN
jgi:hypothetical protein